MDSKLGLIIQLNGVVLITILSLCLRRSLKVTALRHWTMAWLSLSFALICLRLAFSYEEFAAFLFTYYFLGEYLFGFMVVVGCRSLDGAYELKPRSELLFIPFVIAAVILPHLAADFNDVFNIHSVMMSGFYATAFYHLRKTNENSFGWRVMHVSLGLLAFDCIARRGVLGDRGIRSEISRIAEHAEGAPVAGFYTYGEIARTSGIAGFHNQTLVVLAVG